MNTTLKLKNNNLSILKLHYNVLRTTYLYMYVCIYIYTYTHIYI